MIDIGRHRIQFDIDICPVRHKFRHFHTIIDKLAPNMTHLSNLDCKSKHLELSMFHLVYHNCRKLQHYMRHQTIRRCNCNCLARCIHLNISSLLDVQATLIAHHLNRYYHKLEFDILIHSSQVHKYKIRGCMIHDDKSNRAD